MARINGPFGQSLDSFSTFRKVLTYQSAAVSGAEFAPLTAAVKAVRPARTAKRLGLYGEDEHPIIGL